MIALRLRPIFNVLRLLLLGTALVLIVVYIAGNRQAINEQLSTQPDWRYLGLSFLSAALASVVFAVKINEFFSIFGERFPITRVFTSYCRSSLLTILPGGIWNHLNLGSELYDLGAGYSLRQIGILIVLMTGADALSVLLFVPLLASGAAVTVLTIVMSSLVISMIFLIVVVGNRIGKIGTPLRLRRVITSIVLLYLHWLLVGGAFTLMLLAFHQSIPAFGANVAIYDLAWLAGFLFLPAPGGMGVREFVLQRLYDSIGAGITYAVIFSVIFRVLIIMRDILLVTLGLLVGKMPRRTRQLLTDLHGRA